MQLINKEKRNLALVGILIGAAAILLMHFGNPGNMGFCIACFIRDIAGSLGLHSAANLQYMRPEIIALVLGSFFMSLLSGEFKPRSGSSVILRFIFGFFMMVGALVFLGCPLRMVLRLAAGDLNALVALIGFVAGVAIGTLFLSNGFSFGPARKSSRAEGAAFPFINIAMLFVLLFFPVLLKFSESGPGSMRAPIFLSLSFSLIIGALAQKTRLCMAGGVRDVILIRDYTLLFGFVFIFISALIGNLIIGNFNLGFTNQPIAHDKHLWNFLSMALVGLAATLLGGCPLRQLILAGEGNSDSAAAVIGMLLGAAFSHNAGAAAAAVDGPGTVGKVSVIVGLLFLIAVASIITVKNRRSE